MRAGLAGETSHCPCEVTSAPSLCPCACETHRPRLEKGFISLSSVSPSSCQPWCQRQSPHRLPDCVEPKVGMLGTDSKHALLWLQHPLALPLAWLAVPTGPGLWSLFCSKLTPLQEPSGSMAGSLGGSRNSQSCQDSLPARAPSWQGSTAPQREGHGPLSTPRRVVQAQHEAGRCPQRGLLTWDNRAEMMLSKNKAILSPSKA